MCICRANNEYFVSGKTYTLFGHDDNTQNIGLIPCALSWMYRAIEEMKEKTKGRFSVRVSAIEVFGRSEQLNDLLKEFSKGFYNVHFM